MQAVADLHLLQVAQIIVQLGQGGLIAVVRGNPGVPVQTNIAGQIQDLAAQKVQAARVEPRGFIEFIHQQFQFRQGAVTFCPGQGRGQMIDDHRLGAPLGLCPLARIIDDKGIKMRQGAEHGFGETALGKCQGFPGQPFKIAMLAHVNDGLNTHFPP